VEQADSVRRAAYRLQLILGGGLFLVLFLAAPIVAERLYDDPGLTTPLRCAAFILLFYAFYSVSTGYLNGRKLFKKQAVADFAYSTLKVFGILLGAWLLQGWVGGVAGAFAGFAAAAGCVMLIARRFAGPATGPGETSTRELFSFQTFTMAFTFVVTWVSKGDLQILKVALDHDADRVNVLAGEYGVASQFATIPYQLVFAITLVLFPLVSAHAGRDPERIRLYIRQTTRYAAMIAMAVVCLFAACPERTVLILFKAAYLPAAGPLRLLALGYFCYSVFFIMCAVITASGRPRVSLALVGVVLAIQVVLGWALVDRYEGLGVALGTTLGMLAGLVLAQVYLVKSYGQGIVSSVLLRVVGSGLIIAALAQLLLARSTLWGGVGLLANVGGSGLVSKLVTVGGFSVLGCGYIALLMFLGVIDADDRARFTKMLRRGR
ncbi:MAG: oligosaccharide flippase family protein, partial [Salinibacterium sp.]|nr:oligosaccharide flippase family protein [Salinibacterium sp.]